MPTAIVSQILEDFRQHLIDEGIVRSPRVAGSEPVMWIEPRNGTPAPGEMEGTEDDPNCVLSVFRSGGIPPDWLLQRYVMNLTIDVVIRAKTALIRDTVGEAIENAMLGSGGGGELKMEWQMAGTTVMRSFLWRALQPLGADQDGFNAVVSFGFESYTSNT